MKKSKKEWIEFLIACAIIGCIIGFTYSDDMFTNIIIIIGSALVLAILRVAIMFCWNLKKNREG